MKIILFMIIGLSILNAELIRDNYTNIVKDTVTKLEWQDDEIGQKQNFKSAVKQCQNLSLRGSGWRLPSKAELFSIVDKERDYPASDAAFKQTGLSYYWSSTPFTGNKDAGWGVGFCGGTQFYAYYSYKSFVRCVRDSK